MLTNAAEVRRSLKHGQVVELADILRAHVNVESGRVVFHEGWSIAKVIEETTRRGFVCNEGHIENVCKQVLHAGLTPGKETIFSAMKRIRELEFELGKTRADLMNVMDFLTSRHGPGWKLKEGRK